MTKKKKAMVLVVIVGVLAVAALGAFAAVAVPNFLKYRYKSKRAEAQYMLRVLLTKEQEFRAAQNRWAMTPRDLQELMASGPRNSTCFLSPQGKWGGKTPASFDQLPADTQARLAANAPDSADFTVACAVNLDEDEALEVWSIRVSAPAPHIDFADLDE